MDARVLEGDGRLGEGEAGSGQDGDDRRGNREPEVAHGFSSKQSAGQIGESRETCQPSFGEPRAAQLRELSRTWQP